MMFYCFVFYFFFIDSATSEIYTLSLHDALPISLIFWDFYFAWCLYLHRIELVDRCHWFNLRSEEHTSELQSRGHLVCRLLLEKKKTPVCIYSLCLRQD